MQYVVSGFSRTFQGRIGGTAGRVKNLPASPALPDPNYLIVMVVMAVVVMVVLAISRLGHLAGIFKVLRRERRQFPYEPHQPPTLSGCVLEPPRRHPRPPHAVLNDVEEVAVGQALDDRLCEVGYLGVEALRHHRVSLAGSAVTGGAVTLKVFCRCSPRLSVVSKRIFLPCC